MSDQVPSEFNTKYDLSGTNIIGGGIKKINGDGTSLQTLTGDSNIQVVDNGIGDHTLHPLGVFDTIFTPAGSPVLCPNDVLTLVLTLVVPVAGKWFFTGNVNLDDASLPGLTQMRTVIFNGPSVVTETTQQANIESATNNKISASCTGTVLNLVGGEVITLQIHQTNGGPTDLNFNAVLGGVRLGA